MSFMQPEVFHGQFFRVNTSEGTEFVPVYVVGRTCSTHVEALLNYLSGTPDDGDELCEIHEGWLARMSAPGYMDCTDWSAYDTEEEAREALQETYGDED